MPLPPVEPSNTQRYWVDYTVAGHGHTLQMRTTDTVLDADAGATMAAFFAALTSQLLVLTIDGFRKAEINSNISFPVVWPGDDTYGAGAGDPYQSAHFMDFVGKGSGGRRVRASVFGVALEQFGGDYRMSAAESTVVADTIAVLTSDVEMWLDIGLNNPVWHNYANMGVNAYWRNKIR
jgi:hypothetical protein